MNTAEKIETRPIWAGLNSTVLSMAKTLKKDSPRNYAQVVGIVNNRAYVTDGFSLLRFTPGAGHWLGEDRALNPSLNVSQVKYPGVERIFPSASELTLLVGQHELIDSCRKFLKPSWAKCPVLLQVLHSKLSLVPQAPGRDISFDGTAFNPALLMNLCKALPKLSICESVKFTKEMLVIEFSSPSGTYEIVLVAVQKGKK